MSKNFLMLFIWSKGAKTRRKVLKIIADANESDNPIYISEITKNFNYNAIHKQGANQITSSTVRKHVKTLLENNIINPINKGGKPEYLQLTREGLRILPKVRSADKVT